MSETPRIFTGSIPEHYDKYLGPMYFEPYAIDVPTRFDANGMERVLEIGCGTGRVTRHLREALPDSCTLIASDISEDMLAYAKDKLKNENIEWQIIDAQSLPFEDNSIDLVVSCFAFMFVEDKAKAFSEVHRVLKKGGLFLLSLWDKLELNGPSDTYRKIVKEYIPENLPKIYGLPYSFYEKDEVKKSLLDTGFVNVSVDQDQKTAISNSVNEAAFGLSRGGSLYNEIMSRNPAWVDEIQQKLELELAKKYGDHPMKAPMSAVICEATKPA